MLVRTKEFQWRFSWEHISNHIVQVGGTDATWSFFMLWVYWRTRLTRQNLLKLYYNDPDNLVSSRQNTKLVHIMKLNCKEVNSQASFETARTSRNTKDASPLRWAIDQLLLVTDRQNAKLVHFIQLNYIRKWTPKQALKQPENGGALTN